MKKLPEAVMISVDMNEDSNLVTAKCSLCSEAITFSAETFGIDAKNEAEFLNDMMHCENVVAKLDTFFKEHEGCLRPEKRH